MNIPKSVNDWTYELIDELVSKGYLETDYYDFKAELNSKDPNHNKNLAKTACAFANTRGGFVVFGVKDYSHQNKGVRIEGIPPSSDLGKELGDKIRGASPNIHFEFSNPPIPIKGSAKVLFVVHIPQSSDRPHVTSEGLFYYRTNEGNKLMSYEQIREGFLKYEERRYKMKLLYIELLSIATDAQSTIIPDEQISQSHSLVTLESTVLNSLLTDVYSMIQDDNELILDLLRIRQMVSVMNNQIRAFFSKVVLPLSGMDQIIKSHNEAIRQRANALIPTVERVLRRLESRYSLKNPLETKS